MGMSEYFLNQLYVNALLLLSLLSFSFPHSSICEQISLMPS